MPEHKSQSSYPKREEEILQFWNKRQIFEKSLAQPATKGDFVFYDGPPFATGTPHYGHIVGSIMKDAVPRYATMNGYHVERVWGWDCHGLPIENLIEKELGMESKKDIEALGVEKFNAACRNSILRYEAEWKKFIPRMGRWVDMENSYKTMDSDYMESIWWVFKTLYDRGLIYEGKKSMHLCPRCETTLSNFEVTLNYMETDDLSIVVKFRLLDTVEPTYVLAWTTTPWTLPANVALAFGPEIEYVKIKYEGEFYILAKSRLEAIFGDRNYEEWEIVHPEEFVGKKYEPLFDYFLHKDLPNKENLYTIVTADFVSTEEGTGVVHIAPAFGEEDMSLGREKSLPFIGHVTMSGSFTDDISDFKGLPVKPKTNPRETDEKIVHILEEQGKIFEKEIYTHNYPFCWRCDTPLLNYAASSWFVKVTEIKARMIKNNEEIHWVPEHIKHGRFGKWLEGARDWAISRARYWGTPLPVWRCSASECGDVRVIGSVSELRECIAQHASDILDLHRPFIDEYEFVCGACGKGMMERVPEVFDCWFESGSMPYAQIHYPFENKEKFERGFPAEFIAEGPDQTRGWFYTLIVLSSALFDKPAFKNVVVNGIVLGEDGKKMSKRLKNYPDPDELIQKYGADTMRMYLLNSPVMRFEDIRFSEKAVEEVYKKFILMVQNVLSFYTMYAKEEKGVHGEPTHLLDKWILARLSQLHDVVTDSMNEYDFVSATKPFLSFVDDLSTWYVRRSRERFKSEDEQDKQGAISTLRLVLLTFSKLLAPFTPFLAEHVYENVHFETDPESVHLCRWPESARGGEDSELNAVVLIDTMKKTRDIMSKVLEKRSEASIPVRQVLSSLKVVLSPVIYTIFTKTLSQLGDIMKHEVNVQEIVFEQDPKLSDSDALVELNTELTPKLRELGLLRELTRHINALRKEAGLSVGDKVELYYETSAISLKDVIEKFKKELLSNTLTTTVHEGVAEVIEKRKKIVKIHDNIITLYLK